MTQFRNSVCARAHAVLLAIAMMALAGVCAPVLAQFDAAGQAVLMQQHQVHTGNVLSAEQGALNAGKQAGGQAGKQADKQVGQPAGQRAGQRGGNAWGESLASLAGRAPVAGASAPPAALQFRRDPALSARVQREQSGLALSGLSMSPAQMQGKFEALLSRYGYSRDNLGDVAATYLVMAWEVVNDRNAKDVAGGERAVREQLRRALLARPGLRDMDDAQKQALAERLMYSAMRNGVSYQVYRQTDQRAQLASLSEGMRREVMASGLGLDLRQFDLGATGLVRR